MRAVTVAGREFRLLNGDICHVPADAIVNAANSNLAHGGGVAAQIVRNGGREVQDESTRSVQVYGPVPVGGARSTGAGRLPARRVIHVVGPQWGEGGESEKLRSAIYSGLKLAREEKLESIVFPAVSTGIFGFPKVEASEIIIDACESFLKGNADPVCRVDLCLYDDPTYFAFDGTWTRRYGINLPG